MKQHRGVIFHDSFNFEGGGERVVTQLARNLNLDIVTGNIAIRRSFDLIKGLNITSLDIEKNAPFYLRFSKTLQYMNGFLNYSGRTDYDFAFFSGDVAPLCTPKFNCKTYFYCHTPPTVLYGQREDTLKKEKILLKRKIFASLLQHFQNAYEESLNHIDIIIANSQNIKNKIKNYLNRDSIVIYPPVEIDQFFFKTPEDFYLSTARLSPGKQVKKIVEAFKKMPDKKLIILSDGEYRRTVLNSIKNAPNIRYEGWVDETTKKDLISRCIATLYTPVDEDFGITPVESMAAGKPIIGVMAGGLVETVLNEKTGVLIPGDLTAEKIIAAVQKMDTATAVSMKNACFDRAALFSQAHFFEKLKNLKIHRNGQ